MKNLVLSEDFGDGLRPRSDHQVPAGPAALIDCARDRGGQPRSRPMRLITSA